jgi:phage baseplate assembly protein gpV
MAKSITIEEAVNRYAESALVSAVRLRRYWLSQGVSGEIAVERAINQASGMMASSGASLDKLIELFEDLKSACDSFVDMLHSVAEQEGR